MNMQPSLSELINALPDDADIEKHLEGQRKLQVIFEKLSRKPVPSGSLRRLWALGGLKAQIAMAYLVYWMRTRFQDAEQKQRVLLETHLQAAVKRS